MKYFSFFILLFFSSCSVSNEDLNSYMWKYQDGLHLGDVFFIDEKNLRNDTLFVKNQPRYIIETSIGYFGFPTKLTVTDIQTNDAGVYIGK